MWGKRHCRYKTPDGTPSIRTPSGVFGCYPLVAGSKARQAAAFSPKLLEGGVLRTSPLRSSKKFVPLTVRGELRDLPKTLAEIFYPLLGSLPRRAYLRLFEALFAVGTVSEFLELLAGLGV
jgi:hypothetical protein